jgi:hypothetical protein
VNAVARFAFVSRVTVRRPRRSHSPAVAVRGGSRSPSAAPPSPDGAHPAPPALRATVCCRAVRRSHPESGSLTALQRLSDGYVTAL